MCASCVTSVSTAVCRTDVKADTSTCCVSVRPSVCGGGVRLSGEPEGVPPGSPARRVGVLERLQGGFSGQRGGDGAGVSCLPGGPRDGVPRLEEGQFTILLDDSVGHGSCSGVGDCMTRVRGVDPSHCCDDFTENELGCKKNDSSKNFTSVIQIR